MTDYRITIEKNKLSDNLLHKISVSSDEENVFLVIDYMDGKFVIEKIFRNNPMGLSEMEAVMESLDDDEKIKKYLKIDIGEEEDETNEQS